jgi:hypothetical protein
VYRLFPKVLRRGGGTACAILFIFCKLMPTYSASVDCMLQDDGTFTCKHGSSECAGNIQQLCVQQHSKPHRRYDWLFKFVLCSSNQGMDEVGTDKAAATCLKVRVQPLAAAAAAACSTPVSALAVHACKGPQQQASCLHVFCRKLECQLLLPPR